MVNRRSLLLITAFGAIGAALARWIGGRAGANHLGGEVVSDEDQWSDLIRGWNAQGIVKCERQTREFGIAKKSAGLQKHFDDRAQKLGLDLPVAFLDPPRQVDWRKWLVERVAFIEHHFPEFLDDSVRSFCWEMAKNGGRTFPPASSAAISEVERRLKIVLPPSYKAFLKATNGFITEHQLLLGCETLELVRDRLPDVAALSKNAVPISDSSYFVYGEKQVPHIFRYEYLPNCVCISRPYNGNTDRWLLLNPHVISARGEWEAWYLSPYSYGAKRFQSFAELMTFLCEAER